MDYDNIAKLTYEQAMTELEDIVRQLESGKAPLEKSVDLYQQGMALSKHCEWLLAEAENKVTVLNDMNGEKQEVSFIPSDSEGQKE